MTDRHAAAVGGSGGWSRFAIRALYVVTWTFGVLDLAAIVAWGWPSDPAAQVVAPLGVAALAILAWDAVDRLRAWRRDRRARAAVRADDGFGTGGVL